MRRLLAAVISSCSRSEGSGKSTAFTLPLNRATTAARAPWMRCSSCTPSCGGRRRLTSWAIRSIPHHSGQSEAP